ncbi:Pc16g07250 [Penicillium rubens Wisconsin 54-1255]|uniref:Pc16g07250 protein n=1 Tax=Penicillium rubens (strain ATCC 28089 / DSM 1075 / NRRL 1951 / Wisconsin 54-1255) TaxID=500485 RepID=B6H7E3_PENRW|nr:Pc16g07250 [Penicillium rubens Wisconsin 54-1255]
MEYRSRAYRAPGRICLLQRNTIYVASEISNSQTSRGTPYSTYHSAFYSGLAKYARDGNKRTALVAADMFLKINGYTLLNRPFANDPNNKALANAHVAVVTNQ